MVAAAGRADPPPDSGPTAAGESSGAIWERCCAESHAAALFFMAPMIAVSMAPPAPPATACETTPLTLKFPDCAAAKTEGMGSALSEKPASDQARDDISSRAQIKCGGRFAGANAAYRACDEIDQNLFHVDLLTNARWVKPDATGCGVIR